MRRFPSAVLLLMLAAILPAAAQSETSAPKRDMVAVRVLAEVIPDDLGTVYFAAGEAHTPAFDLPANNVSEPVPVPGRALVLKTSAKNLPLCAFNLPDEGKSFVVIFSPAKSAGYRAEAVRTDSPAFKPGDVFFLNRSEQTILGKLGSKPLVLAPGKSAISRPEGATNGAYYDVAFAAQTDGGNKILSTVRWPVDERVRSYVFFVQDANGRVTYRAVDEFVPKDKPKAGG